MSEFVVGDDGVLSWSRPVPPNGDILYYNVIITRVDTGELVRRIEMLEYNTIDLSDYGEIGLDYNVTVRSENPKSNSFRINTDTSIAMVDIHAKMSC